MTHFNFSYKLQILLWLAVLNGALQSLGDFVMSVSILVSCSARFACTYNKMTPKQNSQQLPLIQIHVLDHLSKGCRCSLASRRSRRCSLWTSPGFSFPLLFVSPLPIWLWCFCRSSQPCGQAMPLAVGFQDYDSTKVLKSARVPISISPQVQGSQMVQRMANKLKVSVRQSRVAEAEQ